MIDLLSTGTLTTISGTAAVVTVLTQVIKRYATRLDPKWIALALSILISYALCFITGATDLESLIIAGVRALVASGSSVGLYESGKSVIENLGAALEKDGSQTGDDDKEDDTDGDSN